MFKLKMEMSNKKILDTMKTEMLNHFEKDLTTRIDEMKSWA